MESTGGREFVGMEGKAGEAGHHSPETRTLNLFVNQSMNDSATSHFLLSRTLFYYSLCLNLSFYVVVTFFSPHFL